MSKFSFRWYGKQVIPQVKEQALKAQHTVGEAMLTEANKTVPHDEGTLERSGSVDTDYDAGVTYVSYDTPYAVRWHEAPPGSVMFTDPRARVKWLEQTAREMSSQITKFMGEEMRK